METPIELLSLRNIVFSSFSRFIEQEPVHQPQYILGVGVLGLIVNVIGLFLFHGKYSTKNSVVFKSLVLYRDE
jgi:Co/Zn/Cd efflux system component